LRQTTRILGYDFICEARYEDLADEITSRVRANEPVITNIITPNAHGLNMYHRHPDLERFCKSSAYILPDGIPIVWLSRLGGPPIKRRLTGSDFFPVIFERMRSPEHRCLFIVSKERVSARFKKEKPDARYIIPPFFQMDEHDKIESTAREMADTILSDKINYVFIGISEPKQGALAMATTRLLKSAGFQGPCFFFFLGASYEFYMGLKKRAPRLFQRAGFEWLYRLAAEPRRMYKRYLFGNAAFAFRALKWVFSGSRKNG
jgi:N-acetylglucosaminyldiphosphoundecaprenol N-acetyl-beta-D-mannosaminyltransferase